VVGTAAMFLVGGSILLHGLPGSHEQVHALEQAAGTLAVVGPALSTVTPVLVDAVAGFLAGVVAMVAVGVVSRLVGLFRRR